ncbi:MAG: hypothetical protein DMG87_17055 [Acidobacteria bacterium]|nr:MAG: hypothetical protein DMG87_17055 [Acidobacteriota bacterium]
MRSRGKSNAGEFRKGKSWQTSKTGGRAVVRLAADANVLLASLLGGRARLVMNNPQIEELLTPQVTFAEVQEYAPVLARRKRLPEDMLLLALASLPVTLIEPEAYQRSLSEAKRRIGGRDPDDVDILALAIQFQVPVWSNDKDFEASGIEWYTTEDLLRKLGILNEK